MESPGPLVDWDSVDTVLLDMDGTVLDLNFDNSFWLRHLPRYYADAHGISAEEAWTRLAPMFNYWRGRLEWYCVDHWSRELKLDVAALKACHADLIRVLPGVEGFLGRVRAWGKRLWLVTNAHPASLELKMATTQLGSAFDLILSSHQLGYPKEDMRFWPLFVARHPFEPHRTLMADDSQPVLEAARRFGVAQVCAITHPDTQQPAKQMAWSPAVQGLSSLLP